MAADGPSIFEEFVGAINEWIMLWTERLDRA
jgi:hypothetical protein